jgi:hypothetical protein
MRTNYRKIWEDFHARSIPADCEIHHIDGDFLNNEISNLMLVTKEEHLEIHRSQKDWGAVQAILMRMDNPLDICEVAKKAQIDRWKKGTHNFQKMTSEKRKEVSRLAGLKTVKNKTGIHAINNNPLLSKENGRRGGLASKAKQAGFLNVKSDKHGSKAVKGTSWWVNTDGERKRSTVYPGNGWSKGTKIKGNV